MTITKKQVLATLVAFSVARSVVDDIKGETPNPETEKMKDAAVFTKMMENLRAKENANVKSC